LNVVFSVDAGVPELESLESLLQEALIMISESTNAFARTDVVFMTF
jgi:hypothetical protein